MRAGGRWMARAWRQTLATALAAALISAAGCTEIKTSARDVQWVDPDTGASLVQDRETLIGLGKTRSGVWVDARPAPEYRKGHIPGAINLPYQRLNDEHYVLEDYDVIVVYGSDYGDPKAEGMSKRLMELGYKNVKTLRGGLRMWEDSGRAVETGAATQEQDATSGGNSSESG